MRSTPLSNSVCLLINRYLLMLKKTVRLDGKEGLHSIFRLQKIWSPLKILEYFPGGSYILPKSSVNHTQVDRLCFLVSRALGRSDVFSLLDRPSWLLRVLGSRQSVVGTTTWCKMAALLVRQQQVPTTLEEGRSLQGVACMLMEMIAYVISYAVTLGSPDYGYSHCSLHTALCAGCLTFIAAEIHMSQ